VWATSPLIDVTAEAVQTQAKCSNVKALILRILLISAEAELTLVTGGALRIRVILASTYVRICFQGFFKGYSNLFTS